MWRAVCITVGKHEDTPGVGCGEERDIDFCLFVGVFFFFSFWIGRFRCVVLLLFFTSVLENAEEDRMSSQGPRCPLCQVCHRRWSTEDPAVHGSSCRVLVEG